MTAISACDSCLRRADLVAALAVPLAEAVDTGKRVPCVLSLADEALIEALGGDRRTELRRNWRFFNAGRARALAERAGLAAVCRHDERFPERLRAGRDAPWILHIAGEVERVKWLGEPAATIVGARRPTAYGREVARDLAFEVAATGTPVVSGMALGVDAAAHRGALEARGPTVAVLAGGADLPSPRTNKRLYEEIRRRGLVVSEMPPGFEPRRWSFPARNRIMAALGRLTVVVEATLRSGSLITAEFARQLGQDVGAVPGPVTSRLSAGANALIADGALVVRDGRDVLEELFGPGAAPRRSGSVTELDAELDETLNSVRSGLGTVDAIAKTPQDAGRVLSRLGRLESAGLVRLAADGTYLPVSR